MDAVSVGTEERLHAIEEETQVSLTNLAALHVLDYVTVPFFFCSASAAAPSDDSEACAYLTGALEIVALSVGCLLERRLA